MKCRQLILATMVLCIHGSMHSTVFSENVTDSLVLESVFGYRRNFTPNDVLGYTTNVYLKNNFNVWRRNPTLWLIPSMYSVAEGDRYLMSESYNKLRFTNVAEYDATRQVCFSTIRHNRRAMPTVIEFLTPNLYDVCLYRDHVLSPFNRHNRHYYRYRVLPGVGGMAIVEFRPRLTHTQLVSGTAYVQTATGRIVKATMKGEFDMITFRTETVQGDEGARSLLPKECRTNLVFKFLGNEIYSSFGATYDCPITLPDSLRDVFSLQLMDSIRPVALTAQEEHLQQRYADAHPQEPAVAADTAKKFNFVKDVLQDAIGDNLITSIRYKTERANMKLSPIINPQYVGYSSSHGLSYKLKFGAQYFFNAHRYFEFFPWFGYNFKYRKPYFTLPLYFNYNPKRNGQVLVVYGNGNRIANSRISEDIQHEHGDTLNLDNKQLDLFDDNYLAVSNNVVAYDWLEITSGLTYHHRVPYHPNTFGRYGKPQTYNSFAPMLTVKLRPFRRGPYLSVDYERGIKGIAHADIDYERWEFDASMKYGLKPLRKVSGRLGAGFYSRKNSTYFVDYMHFRDNNLPGGWGDDWTGDFQLLSSRLYNESSYYARANFSYESPLLFASWLPLLGRYVEREMCYLNLLSIDHTRPYTELGYGLKTRFVSIGLFANFLNAEFQGADCKFTFELFRRW